tara:strand:- start:397 stop:639 length:243 start_codon:yes stop_codon:yes gene_type:complete
MPGDNNRWGHLVDNFLLMFVGLKLVGLIEWSWFWVMSPLWITLSVAFGFAFAKSWREHTKREIWKKMKSQRAEVSPIDGK